MNAYCCEGGPLSTKRSEERGPGQASIAATSGESAPRESSEQAPRRPGQPSGRDLGETSALAGRWGQGVGADTPPVVPPAPGRGHRSSGPRPAARRAGPLAQARCRGRRIRAALPLARPASFLPAEPRANGAWPPPRTPPPSSRSRPTPHPARGACRGGVRAGRPPGRAAVGAVPRPAVPPAPASLWPPEPPGRGARGAPAAPDPASGATPRQPARRSKLEPRWRRSEAELCRGRAGYIVSSPRLPPAPLPPPFFPPRPGPRGHPPASVWPSLLPLFSHQYLFVPHPPGTPAPLPSPLAAWTVPQAADAARSEVARTAVPRESSHGTK